MKDSKYQKGKKGITEMVAKVHSAEQQRHAGNQEIKMNKRGEAAGFLKWQLKRMRMVVSTASREWQKQRK